MTVLRGAAGWIIQQAAAMQAATGGRRWRACPPRWRRWRLRCCCEVWQGWQAVGAVQVVQVWRWCVVIVGGGLLLAGSSGAALAVLILPGAGGGRRDLLRRRGAGGVIDRAGPSLIHTDPAGDPVQRAGIRASGGKMGKRKDQGGGAWCAAALAFCLHWRFDLLRRVRPGAGGGADLLAVPVGMVSAGTVPAVGVPASRLALAVLHPGQFCRLPEGSDSPPNGSEKQV